MSSRTTPPSIKTKQSVIPSAIKYFGTSCILSTLLLGCASTGQQGGQAPSDSESVVAAPGEPAPQAVKIETADSAEPAQTEAVEAAEDHADAMMASLAAKSKFDEPKISEPVVKTEEPIAPVVSEVKPTVENVKSATKVEVKEEPVVSVAMPAEAEMPEPSIEVKPTPVKKMVSKSAKPLNATLKDLPIEYDIWKIRKGEATLDKDLVIATPTWDMGESQHLSQIWITIMDDKLLVNSSSDIYAPQGKAGIKLNGGELVPFDRIVERNIGVLDGEQWIDLLSAGGKLDVFMGFFPDRVPKSDIFKSSLELDSLARVVATYKKLK